MVSFPNKLITFSNTCSFNIHSRTEWKVSVCGVILVHIFPHWENADQNNSEYGHFIRSVNYHALFVIPCLLPYYAWMQYKGFWPKYLSEYKNPREFLQFWTILKLFSFGAVCFFIQESVEALPTLRWTVQLKNSFAWISIANKVVFVSNILKCKSDSSFDQWRPVEWFS